MTFVLQRTLFDFLVMIYDISHKNLSLERPLFHAISQLIIETKEFFS